MQTDAAKRPRKWRWLAPAAGLLIAGCQTTAPQKPKLDPTWGDLPHFAATEATAAGAAPGLHREPRPPRIP